MTLDLWTDDYRKLSYLAITIHYIDSAWKGLVERVLCTRHFPESKTGEHILHEVRMTSVVKN